MVVMKVWNEGSMYIYIYMDERFWKWMESVKCGTI